LNEHYLKKKVIEWTLLFHICPVHHDYFISYDTVHNIIIQKGSDICRVEVQTWDSLLILHKRVKWYIIIIIIIIIEFNLHIHPMLYMVQNGKEVLHIIMMIFHIQ